MKTNDQLFELFWENSKLNSKTIRTFVDGINEYISNPKQGNSLIYPTEDFKLNIPNDDLIKIMRNRKSTREFSAEPVSLKKLSSLFVSFMKSESGSRTFASAGATYSLEVFCILNNVTESKLNRKVVYYNSDNHSLSVVKDAPDYNDYKEFINVNTNSSVPPLIFIFAFLSDRVTDKYGDRGGEFALIEIGHAVQNLALRLVQENMVGVEAGGLIDDKIAGLLGIERYPLKIALGYLCGHKVR